MSNFPPEITVLADWRIDLDHYLSIQLHRPTGLNALSRTLNPSVVKIVWPAQPTVFHLQHFSEGAAAACRVFAEASTELAALRARNRYL